MNEFETVNLDEIIEGADISEEAETEIQDPYTELEVQEEPEVQSTEPEVQSTEPDAGAEISEEVETETPVLRTMGIGEFVRLMLLKSTKTNAEILEKTREMFPNAKTSPACVAWYKSDLRKKGLLGPVEKRGRSMTIQLTQAQLEAMMKS